MNTKYLLIAAILALSAPCGAATLQVFGATLASVHTERGYNGNNLGLYAEWDNGLTMGAYQNSESNRFGHGERVSAYVGKLWETNPVAVGSVALRAGVVVGAVTGYERAKVLPFGFVTVSAMIGHDGLRLSFIPPIGGHNGFPGVLNLAYEHRF